MKRALLAALILAGVARGQEDSARWVPTEEGAKQARTALGDALSDAGDLHPGLPPEKLDGLLRRVRVTDLVALVAAPSEGPVGNDVRLAAELVIRAGSKARPYLARALSPESPGDPTRLLLDTAERTGDEGGKLEEALIARSKRFLADGKKVAPLCHALGALGGRTAFSFVATTLLDERFAADSGALSAAGAAILERDKDPDALLSPLLDRIKKLDEARLKDAFAMLGRSKGAALGTIEHLVTRLDRDKTDAAAGQQTADVDPCLSNGIAALVGVGTKEAFAALAKLIQRTHADTHRKRAIVAAMQARADARLDAAESLASLVGSLPSDESTLKEVLVALTGSVATDAASWRRVIEKQRASGGASERHP
ncbi:MAG TPA: hypothetical protein VFF73_28900 [Planctomycetota bacterium]|nr:hypothetical protein [Planctomycetota bacterium]